MTNTHICAPVVEVAAEVEEYYRLLCRTCGAARWASKPKTEAESYRVRHSCGMLPSWQLDYSMPSTPEPKP